MINLAYDDRGSGDPVLFIAGRGGAGRTWHLHQVPAFQRAGYRVITFDNRGIGATENAGGLTTETMVGDTAALIEQLVGGPVRVVGVSMGSFIAQELMLVRPDLVSQAVLMATRGRHDRARTFFNRAERALHGRRRHRAARVRRQNPCAGELFAQDPQRRPGGRRLDGHVHHVAHQRPRRACAPSWRSGLRTTGCPPTGRSRTPVLVIGFADDVVLPAAPGRRGGRRAAQRPLPGDSRRRPPRFHRTPGRRQRRDAGILRRRAGVTGWSGEPIDDTGAHRRRRTDPRRRPRRGAVPGVA